MFKSVPFLSLIIPEKSAVANDDLLILYHEIMRSGLKKTKREDMITGMKKGRTKTVLLSKNFLSMPEIRGILDYARSRQWILRVPRMLNLAEEARNWQGDGVISDNECAMKELKARGIAIVGLTDLPPELLRRSPHPLFSSSGSRPGALRG